MSTKTCCTGFGPCPVCGGVDDARQAFRKIFDAAYCDDIYVREGELIRLQKIVIEAFEDRYRLRSLLKEAGEALRRFEPASTVNIFGNYGRFIVEDELRTAQSIHSRIKAEIDG